MVEFQLRLLDRDSMDSMVDGMMMPDSTSAANKYEPELRHATYQNSWNEPGIMDIVLDLIVLERLGFWVYVDWMIGWVDDWNDWIVMLVGNGIGYRRRTIGLWPIKIHEIERGSRISTPFFDSIPMSINCCCPTALPVMLYESVWST